MTPIVSKRSFFGFYFYLAVASLLCLLLGFMTIGLFIHLYQSPEFETRNYGLLPMFCGIIALMVYLFYRLIKRSPGISVDEYSITFNNKVTYQWADIDKITLNGKAGFLFFYEKEAMTLKFKDGKTFYMIDDLYSNLWQIKLFIKYRVIDKAKNVPATVENPDPAEAKNENFLFYKRFQLLNFRGIMLWMILAGLGYAAIKNISHPVGLIFISSFACLAFFGLSYFLYYVGVSDNYLIVRNHNFFWVKKLYRLTDIKEVVFEQQDKWPNCVIVITNDFKTNFFPAATLWGRDFRTLKQDLLSRNIAVRDEIRAG